jgi:hypothetical protein
MASRRTVRRNSDQSEELYSCYYGIVLDKSTDEDWEVLTLDYVSLSDLFSSIYRFNYWSYYSIYKLTVPKKMKYRTHCYQEYILDIERELERELSRHNMEKNPEAVYEEFIRRFKEENRGIEINFKRIFL